MCCEFPYLIVFLSPFNLGSEKGVWRMENGACVQELCLKKLAYDHRPLKIFIVNFWIVLDNLIRSSARVSRKNVWWWVLRGRI